MGAAKKIGNFLLHCESGYMRISALVAFITTSRLLNNLETFKNYYKCIGKGSPSRSKVVALTAIEPGLSPDSLSVTKVVRISALSSSSGGSNKKVWWGITERWCHELSTEFIPKGSRRTQFTILWSLPSWRTFASCWRQTKYLIAAPT